MTVTDSFKQTSQTHSINLKNQNGFSAPGEILPCPDGISGSADVNPIRRPDDAQTSRTWLPSELQQNQSTPQC
uniref:Uncharacterized protein n=1 Tax=Anguilla anguilla TaxID=7936 RepID=A0A0E9WFS6_ANGAN